MQSGAPIVVTANGGRCYVRGKAIGSCCLSKLHCVLDANWLIIPTQQPANRMWANRTIKLNYQANKLVTGWNDALRDQLTKWPTNQTKPGDQPDEDDSK